MAAVEGIVHDANGVPLAGALVRLKTEGIRTTTDPWGRFRLGGFEPRRHLRVTAWADGYYIGGEDAWPWRRQLDIELRPYTLENNSSYRWVPAALAGRTQAEERWIQRGLSVAAGISFDHAFLPLSERLALGCRDCHGQVIYEEWAGSAHALGAGNPIFMSMYNGTDASGTVGRGIELGRSPYYYNKEIVPPTGEGAEAGPGFRLDVPDAAGNCAACHLPSAALDAPYDTDPNTISGVEAQGSHCDFCHKVVEVRLDPTTGLPAENLPGVLSLEVVRPGGGEQVFFGPYDDVDVGPDTYLPLMKEGEICAPCHSATFWGVPIYQSFGEWLDSPYSDPVTGQTCQDCHMRPNQVANNFAPSRGGLPRDPASLPTHKFPGAADRELLADAVSIEVDSQQQGDELIVEVTIENDNTGHHIPSDSPLRQLILVVDATTVTGDRLQLVNGPTLPDWTGIGDPTDGYLAGLPGRAYAKILEDQWTGVSPAASYWNPTRIVSDNRIPAQGIDTTTYIFGAIPGQQVCIQARLIFRRAFRSLVDQKGWDSPDIIMQEVFLPQGCG